MPESEVGAPYLAGFGTAEICPPATDMCLMGWAHKENVASFAGMPLRVRTLFLQSPSGVRMAYVCADLCFVSQAIRRRVLQGLPQDLQLQPSHLMLSATHTHSGPSGYSNSLFYAGMGPGVSEDVQSVIVLAILESLRQAFSRLTPAALRYCASPVPLSAPVAFNRSLSAYNRNTDVTPQADSQRDRAVNRQMTALRVDAIGGTALGQICWFGLHPTSFHSDNKQSHPDHFGIAAQLSQDRIREEGHAQFVSVFAQGAAGDVTSNYRWHRGRRKRVGKSDVDEESAHFVGRHLAEHAVRLFERNATSGRRLGGEVSACLEEKDFAQLDVHPDFAFGRKNVTTSPPVLGYHFAFGTAEGPGPFRFNRPFRGFVSGLSKRVRAREVRRDTDDDIGGAKLPFWDFQEYHEGAMLGVPKRLPFFDQFPNKFVRFYRSAMRKPDEFGVEGWVPKQLPLQMIRIGELLLVGLPNEPTTHAGRKIAALLRKESGVNHAVVNGYCNAYSSYMCTHDEYHEQSYEGTSTLYGPWTLGAVQTVLRQMSRTLTIPRRDGV